MKFAGIIVALIVTAQSAFADLGQHFYGKYVVRVNVSVSTELEQHTTDVMIYIADSKDQTYNPDLIGTKITRIDFRTDGGSAALIRELMLTNQRKGNPTSIYALPTDRSGYYKGTTVSSWPN